jgi:hypothetical protein
MKSDRETREINRFRIGCSGTACLRARYSTATVRERLSAQTEIAINETRESRVSRSSFEMSGL